MSSKDCGNSIFTVSLFVHTGVYSKGGLFNNFGNSLDSFHISFFERERSSKMQKSDEMTPRKLH